MNVENEILNLYRNELQAGLYNLKYNGIPIWRLYRFNCRNRALKLLFPEYTNKSKKAYDISVKKTVNIVCRSFASILRLRMTNTKVSNIFFAFPRLQNIDGILIDKFTDPVIDYSDLKNDVIVFQKLGRRWSEGDRWMRKRVIYSESIVVISYVLSILYFVVHFFSKPAKDIALLYNKAKLLFPLTKKDLLIWHLKFVIFRVMVNKYKSLFKRLCCKRIFVVDREVFFPQLAAAHMSNISSYELQHGVTCGETVLYTGHYDSKIDPDYFLTFGDIWRGNQFSIPIDKMINIGWAYKNFIQKEMHVKEYPEYTVLVISSPEITRNLVNTIIDLAKMNRSFEFHIRTHPQEIITDELKQKIKDVDNVFEVDNTQDSFIAIQAYHHILGENSTVLYEALSMGKNVGCLSYNGFNPIRLADNLNEGFFYLRKAEDFKEFVRHKVNNLNNNIFSLFNPTAVNNLK